MKTKWGILLLILTGFIAYGNTLKNGLFWDDDEFIVRNAYIRSFRYLPQWFSQPLTAGAGVNSNYYRPLLQLSFAIDYKLWGLWPAGYHIENFLWHSLAGILLFVFLNNLLPQIFNFSRRAGSRFAGQFSIFKPSQAEKKTTISNQQLTIITFAASLLWLVHPVHVEAVAYANSRGDSMATVFILLSLILWLKNRIRGSAVAFILALLSKEFAIVTPGLMALISFVNLTNGKFTKLPTAKLPVFVKETPRRTSRSLLIMFIIAAIYIFLRLTTLNFQNTLNFYGVDVAKANQNQPLARYATSLPIRLMTFLKVLPIYGKILIWPTDLHMERTVEIATTAADKTVIVVAAVVIATLLYCYIAFRRKKFFVPFAIAWFAIAILPTSGLIPISQILAEHFLYLPSIGFFLMIAWLLALGVNQASRLLTIKRLNDPNHLTFMYVIYWTILLIISIPLVSKTIRQNRIWRDPITFYEYTLSKTAPTARVYNNLAMAYAETKEPQKAINNYQLAISLGDVYPNPHYNMANTLVEQGRMDEAESEYKRALEIDPNFHYATLKLGQMYANQGKIDEAKKLVCPVFPTQPLCL